MSVGTAQIVRFYQGSKSPYPECLTPTIWGEKGKVTTHTMTVPGFDFPLVALPSVGWGHLRWLGQLFQAQHTRYISRLIITTTPPPTSN